MLEKLLPAPETLSDSPTPVKTVFLPLHAETLAAAGDLYWADNPDGTRSVKGGGVVGGPTELRYWEGDVAELGPAPADGPRLPSFEEWKKFVHWRDGRGRGGEVRSSLAARRPRTCADAHM